MLPVQQPDCRADLILLTQPPMRMNDCMDDQDPIMDALADAEAKLQRLKSVNQLTTDAQRIFAELGLRVDAVLQERRSGTDRRGELRTGNTDRRHTA